MRNTYMLLVKVTGVQGFVLSGYHGLMRPKSGRQHVPVLSLQGTPVINIVIVAFLSDFPFPFFIVAAFSVVSHLVMTEEWIIGWVLRVWLLLFNRFSFQSLQIEAFF